VAREAHARAVHGLGREVGRRLSDLERADLVEMPLGLGDGRRMGVHLDDGAVVVGGPALLPSPRIL